MSNNRNLDQEAVVKEARRNTTRRFRSKKHRREAWSNLTGEAFEQVVAQLFEDIGYEVQTNGRSGDRGVDLFLRINGVVHCVQCKAWKNKVGPDAVRALQGARQEYENMPAVLICVNGATKGAKELAYNRGIDIVDVNTLMQLEKPFL